VGFKDNLAAKIDLNLAKARQQARESSQNSPNHQNESFEELNSVDSSLYKGIPGIKTAKKVPIRIDTDALNKIPENKFLFKVE